MEVENKKRVIVGVNQFQIEEKPAAGLLRVDAAAGEFQKKKLADMKAKRDNNAVKNSLADLEKAAQDEKVNLIPPILAAVKNYATLGEICGVLRKVFGEYEASLTL